MANSNLFNSDSKNPKQIFVLDVPSLERDKLIDFLGKSGLKVFVYSSPTALFNERMLADGGLLSSVVLLSNIELPSMGGLDLLERLKFMGQEMPVIFYGKTQAVAQGVAAVKNGAMNFLVTPFDNKIVLEAVEDGLQTAQKLLAASASRENLQSKLSILSPREQEVFHLLIKGYSNSELVSALGVSLDTAKQYKTSLMKKLEAKSLSQLISMVPAGIDAARMEMRA
jgi:FixJ family two-component response regulator